MGVRRRCSRGKGGSRGNWRRFPSEGESESERTHRLEVSGAAPHERTFRLGKKFASELLRACNRLTCAEGSRAAAASSVRLRSVARTQGEGEWERDRAFDLWPAKRAAAAAGPWAEHARQPRRRQ